MFLFIIFFLPFLSDWQWVFTGLVIQSFFNPWLQNAMMTYYFSLSDRLPLKGQLRIESVVIYETMMNLGRVVSISLFCIFVLVAKFVSAEVFLFAIACTQLFIVFFVDKKMVVSEK